MTIVILLFSGVQYHDEVSKRNQAGDNMDLQMKGLTAVVTGGTGGIGGAIVHTLAGEGCNVAFCSRSQANVDAMLASLAAYPVRTQGRAIDVTDAAAMQEWLAEIGTIDIFIANVSAISPQWDASIAVDIQATVDSVEAVLPYLRRSKHGALTYIGSLATDLTTYDAPGYSAAKTAMTYYMRSLSRVLASEGVRVNVVSPGTTLVQGGWWDRIRMNAPEAFENTRRSLPMGRLGTGEEVARVVAFISSPAASFVAGANWFVDGAEAVPAFPHSGSEQSIRARWANRDDHGGN